MKNKYNWHFWVWEDEIQAVIESTNYSSAVNRMKKFVGYKKFKF
jgi:hypothetical protein